jgi:hypothetical protein
MSLKELFDFKVSNESICSDVTEEMYDMEFERQASNKSLKSDETTIEFYEEAKILSADFYPFNIWSLQKSFHTKFTNFMGYMLTDFRSNCNRPTPFNSGDERSIFDEVLLPTFKYFGNELGHLSFVWGKKQCSTS